jgi:hypothetical protein
MPEMQIKRRKFDDFYIFFPNKHCPQIEIFDCGCVSVFDAAYFHGEKKYFPELDL